MPPRAAVRSSALRRVRLGPVLVAGHTVIVRNTKLSDFERWREIRLRDREYIEPFWTTSTLSWDERHSRAWWIREYLRQRHARALRRALPLSVLVDGEFAGQCNLIPIDPHNRSAEIGIWTDSRRAGAGVGSIAGAMVTDYGLGPLGLHRITAPACVGNRPARGAAIRSGMFLEATMIGAISVNGRRRDHELWTITADKAPVAGYVAAVIAAGVDAEPQPSENRSVRSRLAEIRRNLVAAAPAQVLAVAIRYYLGAPLRWRSMAAVPLPDAIAARNANGEWVSLDKRTRRLPSQRTRRVRYEVEAAGRPIGEFTLDFGGANVELTIELTPEPARTRAAATALTLLVEHLMSELGVERLEARIDPAATHLTTLAAAGGFRREGLLSGARIDREGKSHDLEIWAVTTETPARTDIYE
ncbi:GNAT family N-acetyltransferase [Nocardia uniformis]|uniref:GNAT family N-acetyltransferase n=1 Tax=Nocardia uniformis TaxID=53432 RepID=A0A849BZN8_9NOCA|nr:GNAT family protein [Nocardia uniformis]NNH70788.1 GNAT family N-acetyltransferase [Nocardia uniformis]